MTQIANRWTPHWAIHPGEHLLECIEARGLAAEEFARLAGIPAVTVDATIAGRHPITHDIAMRIDDVLGIMPEFWFVLQSKWHRHQDGFRPSA
jgi:addiction module HigA family antidote